MKKDATNNSPSSSQTLAKPRNPPKPKTDYSLARTLYAQGLTYDQISAQTGIAKGTLAWRSSKEQWPSARKATRNQMASQTASQWLERASQWRERVAQIAETKLDLMAKHSDKVGFRALGDYLDSLDKLDKLGRRQFGLDAQASSPQVQVITSGNVLLRRDDREREASEPAGDDLGTQGDAVDV